MSNRVPIRLVDDQWNMTDRMVEFSGITGMDTVITDFVPTHVFADPFGQLSDATTDYYEVIHGTGTRDMSDVYFKLETKQIADSALFFISHNWVEPDTLGTNLPGLTLSTSRYWTVDGIFPVGFQAKGSFFYSRFNELDGDIITSSLDSLVILYRPSAAYPWQSVNFTKQGLWTTGWFHVDNLQAGQYAIASWDAQYAGVSDKAKEIHFMQVFPNPSQDSPQIKIQLKGPWTIQVNDSQGKIVYEKIGRGDKTFQVPEKYMKPSGVYFISLLNRDQQLISREKWIRSR